MRLLNATTYVLREFPSELPRYAILSHRWEAVEVTFADIEERGRLADKGEHNPSVVAKASAWAKVENACRVAREQYGYEWLWLDMCCIDKTSSSELQEAINSMFGWYRDADLCLAYLNDVPDPAIDDPRCDGSRFRQSIWFTRGWTLQELIAPDASMVFLSQEWSVIGRRSSLAAVIADITKVDMSLLASARHSDPNRLDLSRWSISKRMCWAANRTTTRAEDRAYSLAGLFDVTMPIVYGEGGEKAFWRLQLEIIRQSHDQSIFAWGTRLWLRQALFSSFWGPSTPPDGDHLESYTRRRNLLASQPSDFLDCPDMRPAPVNALTDLLGIPPLTDPHYSRTNYGIRIILPLHPTKTAGIVLAALSCQDTSTGYWRAMVLMEVAGDHTYVCLGYSNPDKEQYKIVDAAMRTSLPSGAKEYRSRWKATAIYIKWQAMSQGTPNSHPSKRILTCLTEKLLMM